MKVLQRAERRRRGSTELTPREAEVLNKFLENGCSNQDLADALGVTYSTAKTHLVNIRCKLGYGSREELAVCVLRLRYAKAFEAI